MENFICLRNTLCALLLLACGIALQNCKHDEPLKKDTYPLTAILSVNAGGRLFFTTISVPDKPVIDYFNAKSGGFSLNTITGPWYFRNMYYDEADRFFEKDTNGQYQVKDTFLMKCKIHEDYYPPGPMKGFGPRYPYVEIVAIKPYK